MGKLDKYSKKCIDYITKNKCIDEIKLDDNTNSLLKLMYTQIEKTDKQYDLQPIQKTKISKQKEEGVSPIIYDIFDKLLKDGVLTNMLTNVLPSSDISEVEKHIKNNNFNSFFKWYNKHQDKVRSVIESDYGKQVFKSIPLQLLFLYDNRFVPLDVLMFVEYNDFRCNTYKVDNINITTMVPPTSSYDINKIVHICKFMTKLANRDNQEININILYSDRKKKIRADTILTPTNINSGSSITELIIDVWRDEEIDKVLIHELVHYLSLDVTGNTDMLKTYSKKFNVKGNILINEAYTESIAVTIHTLYVMYKSDIKYNLDDFKTLFINEVNYSLFQVAKLMNHFKIKDLNQIFKKYTGDKPYFEQTTSVFSYFVVKTAIIMDLNSLLQYVPHNSIKFNNNRVPEFIKFIEASLKNSNFNKCVKFYLDRLSKNDKFIDKTLRMTCLQLDY
jgi:hypothetical protein